jgi:hypothetical protein
MSEIVTYETGTSAPDFGRTREPLIERVWPPAAVGLGLTLTSI